MVDWEGIIPVLCLVLVMCMHLFFEKDARQYEKDHLPDVWFILAVLEYALVAHSLDAGRKTVRNNLRRLHKEMQARTPDLLS